MFLQCIIYIQLVLAVSCQYQAQSHVQPVYAQQQQQQAYNVQQNYEPVYQSPDPRYPSPNPEPAYLRPGPAYQGSSAPAYPSYVGPAQAYEQHQYQPSHYQPAAAAAPAEPKYLGQFKNAKNHVQGDIFELDDHTLYIQGFNYDGLGPLVYFWANGVAIPYYTRTNPTVQTVVGGMNNEDVVLVLPPEIPTVHAIKSLQVWCHAYSVSFGEILL